MPLIVSSLYKNDLPTIHFSPQTPLPLSPEKKV